MGRRPTLTAEEKLKRQRNRWTRDKTRQRSESAESQWLRTTSFGYVETCQVFHLSQWTEYLVCLGLLSEVDEGTPSRVDDAGNKLLDAYKLSVGSAPCAAPYLDFRPRTGAGIGEVRVKVTLELVKALGLEDECDNRRKIKTAIEELIFGLYSNIADLTRPNPCPQSKQIMLRTAVRLEKLGYVHPASMWNEEGRMQGRRRPKEGWDEEGE